VACDRYAIGIETDSEMGKNKFGGNKQDAESGSSRIRPKGPKGPKDLKGLKRTEDMVPSGS
jgi:hypothetical protein